MYMLIDPFVSERVMKNNGVKVCKNIEELYSKCQYISLHMPANDKTKKSIGYDLLKKMPKNAVLVNTARKEVIDEEVFLRFLRNVPISGTCPMLNLTVKPCLKKSIKEDLYLQPKKWEHRLRKPILMQVLQQHARLLIISKRETKNLK